MRAIILAAGMGTRLRPITLTTPKSLIEVAGTSLIERQIEFLRAKGIEDIIVVTGYLAEKFDFLKDQYGVTLIHNDQYESYNNFYTMYLVRHYLSDAYVIDADNFLVDNFLLSAPESSLYFGVAKEWVLHYQQDDLRVTAITVESGQGRILSGVSYWSAEDGQHLQQLIESYYQEADYANLYWDDVVKDNLADLNVHVYPIEGHQTFEIDSLEDLEALRLQMEAKN